jgi:hypothetical protein
MPAAMHASNSHMGPRVERTPTRQEHPMNRTIPTVPLLVLAALLAGTACGGASSSERSSTASAPHEFVSGPHVPTGTAVHVRLMQPLDLSSSTEGASIAATLEDDLRTPEGTILVRSGAALRGHVAWSARTGRVLLRNAQVDSPVGPIDIHAALVGAGQPDATTPAASFHNAAPDAPRTTSPLARQAGPTQNETPRGRLPSDTLLTLQLTRPLLAPGSRVLAQ